MERRQIKRPRAYESYDYSYLTERIRRTIEVKTRSGPKKVQVLIPRAKIQALLFALGLSTDQLWPPRPYSQRSRSFWKHNEHRLLELLDLAHRGWKKKMKKSYPREHEAKEDVARSLNVIFADVKRRFKAHGATLG